MSRRRSRAAYLVEVRDVLRRRVWALQGELRQARERLDGWLLSAFTVGFLTGWILAAMWFATLG